MYEGFAEKNRFSLEGIVKNQKTQFDLLYSLPYMPGGRLYMQMMNTEVKPVDFTDWRDETLSWHLSCSVSAGLNPSPCVRIKGPEAAKFLKESMINNIDKFPINSSKHGIMCVENGMIASQGVLLRTAEDTYEAMWLSPYLDFKFAQKKYDATLENLTEKLVIIQTQGPRSLEMVEEAAHEDLHDIKFCRFRDAEIANHPVRILRFGMYGCLGYEVHCATSDAHDVYEALLKAGQPYGVRRLGFQAYMMDHTPGGSQQLGFHFIPALDPAMLAPKDDDVEMKDSGLSFMWYMTGSLGEDYSKRLVNPIEIGLEKLIDWNKGDFPGRAALKAYSEQTRQRGICTLKWNYEDLGDIYMSQYRDEEPYAPMDWPGKPWSATYGGQDIEMDVVLDKDGNEIGYSAGRTTDYYHRAMVSLGIIQKEFLKEGEEVIVVWGSPGTRQKKVRAVVTHFPFNKHLENRSFDVETIPHPKF